MKAIEPWQDAYTDVEIRYLAVRQKDALHLAQVRATFGWNFEPSEKFRFETANVAAGRFLISDTGRTRDTFLSALLRGNMIGPGIDCTIDDAASYSGKLSKYHPEGLATWGRLTVLSATYASISIDEDWDWELRAADTPYDGLNDLIIHVGLNLPSLSRARVELVGWTPAIINSNRSQIVDGKATIIAEVFGGLNREDLRLTYRVARLPKVESRGVLSGSDLTWSPGDGKQTVAAEVEVPEGAVVQAFAVVNGYAQHSQWIAAPNIFPNRHRTAFNVFDKDLGLLRANLVNEKGRRDSTQFEAAISSLLWMYGFSVSMLGPIEEAPDLLATTPTGHYALIECTLGILKADKLSNLSMRRAALRRRLDEAGLRHLKTIAIMVTALSKEQVADTLVVAARQGVGVLTMEDLLQLLNATVAPQDAEVTFSRTEESIRTAQANATGGEPAALIPPTPSQ